MRSIMQRACQNGNFDNYLLKKELRYRRKERARCETYLSKALQERRCRMFQGFKKRRPLSRNKRALFTADSPWYDPRRRERAVESPVHLSFHPHLHDVRLRGPEHPERLGTVRIVGQELHPGLRGAEASPERLRRPRSLGRPVHRAAGVPAGQKAVSRFTALLIVLGVGYIVLVNGMLLARPFAATASTERESPRQYLVPSTFVRVGERMINVRSLNDGRRAASSFSTRAAARDRFTVAADGTVTVRGGSLTLATSGPRPMTITGTPTWRGQACSPPTGSRRFSSGTSTR